jgi:hypothetical protein
VASCFVSEKQVLLSQVVHSKKNNLDVACVEYGARIWKIRNGKKLGSKRLKNRGHLEKLHVG